MKKIFLDSDVLLDLLLDRAPFADDIATIIEQSIADEVKLCVSPITMTNINYIVGRIENEKKAAKEVKKLLLLIDIENAGQSTVEKAAESKFKDFEDAVQNFCAAEAGHQIILTRNTKDYKESELSILTPKEYLAKITAE